MADLIVMTDAEFDAWITRWRVDWLAIVARLNAILDEAGV